MWPISLWPVPRPVRTSSEAVARTTSVWPMRARFEWMDGQCLGEGCCSLLVKSWRFSFLFLVVFGFLWLPFIYGYPCFYSFCPPSSFLNGNTHKSRSVAGLNFWPEGLRFNRRRRAGRRAPGGLGLPAFVRQDRTECRWPPGPSGVRARARRGEICMVRVLPAAQAGRGEVLDCAGRRPHALR